MLAWHFVGDSLRNGCPVPPDGYTLRHRGLVVPCRSGLHASEHPFDALRYAPGPTLCLVRLGGVVVPHGDPVDKLAASERTIVARMDFTEPLRRFARLQALSVVHLWDAPDVVLDYLRTGDDKFRAAAWAAAWAVTRGAAQDATLAAARGAAWAVTRGAAQDATLAAARAAARAAPGAAAWAAAWAAARAAPWAAAWTAAWDATRAKAWDATWSTTKNAVWTAKKDAVQAAARKSFRALVCECFAGPLSEAV